ncbi:MAG: hypothetical protein A2X47_01480 [Lentisphaerae bacterium GWF2_38_69]|nr:MAG: hypothetical protein A2X47_01480 [Lentisphaerae bacterium GWF2_38_69]
MVYPTVLADSERFLIKIAETDEELKATLKLRYEVFNVEQGHGLDQCASYGLDFDEYDKYCLQLVVLDKQEKAPVGTYRLHLGSIALEGKGFYSSTEYEIKGLEKIASISMELGRSCVRTSFRTGAAVALLWGGIGELMMRAKLRYLFGCVSMEAYNAAATWAIYEHFKKDNLTTDLIKGTPLKGFELDKSTPDEIKIYSDNIRNTMKDFVPPLLKGYLRLGTKICGEPLFDPVFKTVDFLILLDTFSMPERYARHFNYKPAQSQAAPIQCT